jgi:DNA repair exonuclease SbcCD ATPase subunit
LKLQLHTEEKIVQKLQTKIHEQEILQKKYAHLDISKICEMYKKHGDNLQIKYDENKHGIEKIKARIEELYDGEPDINKSIIIKRKLEYVKELEKRMLKKIISANELMRLVKERSKLPSKTVLEANSARALELKDEMGNLKQSIDNAEDAIEALKDHEYNPKCEFCINNKLVKNARNQEKGLPNLRKRMKRVKKEYEPIENTPELLSKLEDIDRQIRAQPHLEPIDLNGSKEWSRLKGTESVAYLSELLLKAENTVQEQTERQSNELRLKQLEEENKLLNPLLKYNAEELSELAEKLTELRDTHLKKDRKVQSLNERIHYSEKQQKKYKKKELELEDYKEYEVAIGRNGIPKILRNQMIGKLEIQINDIIGGIAAFNVRIDEESSTIRFVNDIRWKKMDIAAYMGSGSEKLLIEMALRTVIAKKTAHSSNLLIMDESLSYLDANKREVLDGLFTALNKYFKTVLVISHDVNVKEHVGTVIAAEKGVDWKTELEDMPVAR